MSNYGDQYGGQSGNDPYGNNPYGNDPYGQSPYGGPPGSPYGAPPVDPNRAPLRGASIADAYRRYWKKYADFKGRASRSEFWWTVLVNAIIGIILNVISDGGRNSLAILSILWSLATIVPSLAIGARRLHDTNRSGWWQLIAIIPLIGWIILIVWWATGPKPEGQRYDVA